MTFLLDTLKGIFIGIANIIPGLSGGTLALSFGIYDKMISSVSNLKKTPKKSILTLLPIVIGCAIGIIGFTYAIEYLLLNHTFATSMAFTGLILGGIPILWSQLKKAKRETKNSINLVCVLIFIFFFAGSITLSMFGSADETFLPLTLNPVTVVLLFFVGIIASATMVVPGVSGSLVLMILGYYYSIIATIRELLDALRIFDIPTVINAGLILFPFGIGVLLGIFLIAKLITFLFERFPLQTYCGILGLLLSSPIAIFHNTGAFHQVGTLPITTYIIGFILAIVSGVITYYLGEQ